MEIRLKATPTTPLLHPSTTMLFFRCSCGTALVTLAKCRNLKYVKVKFQGSLDMIKGLCGNSTNSHPIIFRWSNLKGGNLNLVKLFDQAGHLSWRSPREFSPGFACDFVLASFLNSPSILLTSVGEMKAAWRTWPALAPYGF